jgi:hypothetical protein
MQLPIFGFAFVLFLLATADPQFVYAQRINYFTLPAQAEVLKLPWRDRIYRFQEFQKGKITYTKGFELEHEFDLNYNVYFERMDFIDSSGDTLCITNTQQIKSIQIGNTTFFHENTSGYYEVLVRLPVALAFRNQFVLEELEFGNGVKSRGTPTDRRGAITDYGRSYRKVFSYFFIDQKNEVHPATKATVLKLFPTRATEIKGYLLEHRVDFGSREDLIELTNYCNQFFDGPDDGTNTLGNAITLRLPAGKKFPSKRAMDSLYRFPEFQDAKVIWTDQSSSFHPEKMNYNIFTGKMDVIDEKGDTIKFTRWHETQIVNLDGAVFFQDLEMGFLEILLHGEELVLAVRNNFTIVSDKAALQGLGLMDQATASELSKKTPVTTFDRLYRLEKTYFFIYRNDAYEANKFSILKLMRKDRDAVIDYLNENNISLTDEQQLKQLTTYCNRLLTK